MSEQNQDKHQQRQQKVKQKVDERIAAAQKEQGIFLFSQLQIEYLSN